ncbi:hypothetical protein ANCDUO_05805 [Ancylostoma duodenale]|uniref:G-protein coupled receptors family 1 profile domain-containing protein n=1 Tax=Ancylostoma duodenale TaxID=51022 RepID=A0A0C2GXW7_9BILA|nr:hypothetical protein ANCDUO_05805 [Ancylostoma duodenale]
METVSSLALAAHSHLLAITLFFLYHRYIIPTFFIAKTVQFAIPFLLILITLERYIWTTKEKTRQLFAPVFNDKGRCITVSILVILSVALRLPVLFAAELYGSRHSCQKLYGERCFPKG